MKPIRIHCPICNTLLELEPEIDLVRCSGCGKLFKVKIEITLEDTKIEKIR